MRAGLKVVMRAVFAALTSLLAAACSAPDPLASLQPGETGRVVRVIDGDALVLDTGLSVRLAGVEAPAGASRDRPAAPYAAEAARVLETLSMGRRVALYHGGLSRDRYGRAIAQVRLDDDLGPKLWLNLAIVEAGAARVRLYPDNESLGPPLLAAEAQARTGRRGVWSVPDYAIASADSLSDDARGFLIVEGVLAGRAPPSKRPPRERDTPPACRLRVGGLAIAIAPGAERLCATPDGSPVRVRGYVRDGEMAVETPGNLEILPPAQR
jgi:endonuclease YncB( thermonuclease family)